MVKDYKYIIEVETKLIIEHELAIDIKALLNIIFIIL